MDDRNTDSGMKRSEESNVNRPNKIGELDLPSVKINIYEDIREKSRSSGGLPSLYKTKATLNIDKKSNKAPNRPLAAGKQRKHNMALSSKRSTTQPLKTISELDELNDAQNKDKVAIFFVCF